MAAEALYGSKAWREQKAATQRQLDECLRTMADHEFENEEEIISCARVLAEVYSDREFRHRYSSIVEAIESYEHPTIDEGEARERINKFNAEIEQEQARATCLASNQGSSLFTTMMTKMRSKMMPISLRFNKIEGLKSYTIMLHLRQNAQAAVTAE